MRDLILKVSAIGWIATTALCILGPVKVFAPLSVVLLAIAFAADSEKKFNPAVFVIFSIATAGAVFFGIQEHEHRLEQVAYFAHRQAIGCSDTDLSDATVVPSQDDPRRELTESDIQRCSADDAQPYKFALGKKGWPSTWLK
jgi:hypothetical protein